MEQQRSSGAVEIEMRRRMDIVLPVPAGKEETGMKMCKM